MILQIITDARKLLIEEGVNPPYLIKLSPLAHDQLTRELAEKSRRRAVRVFEVLGMRVDIDEECPTGGAYLLGEDNHKPEQGRIKR